jgi:Protein of unknown function (DUF3433)
MTISPAAWDMVVNASWQRQPFVDLRRSQKDAVSAEKTVMVNYAAVSGLWNWVVAFRNRHVYLGCTFLLALVFSVVSLTADLF